MEKKIIVLAGLEGSGIAEISSRLANVYGCERINIEKPFINYKHHIRSTLIDTIILYGKITQQFLLSLELDFPSHTICSVAIKMDEDTRVRNLKTKGYTEKKIRKLLNSVKEQDMIGTMWECRYKINNTGIIKDVIFAIRKIVR